MPKPQYTMIAREFLDSGYEGPGDIYERFYDWLINVKGGSIEKAESEVATFMETVADLMD